MYTRKVHKLFSDWCYTTDNGQEYNMYITGENNVKSIMYHEPQNIDEKHYCDIEFEDGGILREFNISSMMFYSDKNIE